MKTLIRSLVATATVMLFSLCAVAQLQAPATHANGTSQLQSKALNAKQVNRTPVFKQSSTRPCTRMPFVTGIGEQVSGSQGLGDVCNSVKPVDSPQCGYVMAGSSLQINGLDQMMVVRTQDDGTVLWAWKYALDFGNGSGELHNIEVLDQGFVVTGWANGISRDMIVMRLNVDGTVAWARIYMEDYDQEGVEIEECANGDFAAVGNNEDEILLVRTQFNGTPVWEQTYGNVNQIWDAFSMEHTADDPDGLVNDGFVICGTQQFIIPHWPNTIISDREWVILKADANGNLEWTETIALSNLDEIPYTIKQIDLDADGQLDTNRFAVAGYFNTSINGSTREDGLLVFVTHLPSGSMYNARTYSDGLGHTRIRAIEPTNDNGFILTGHHEAANAPNRDAFLIRTPIDGSVTWSYSFGDSDRDDFSLSVEQVDDDGFVFGGVTHSFSPWDQDMYFVATSSTGTAPCRVDNDILGSEFFVHTYLAIPAEYQGFPSFTPNMLMDEPIMEQSFCTTGKRGTDQLPRTSQATAATELMAWPNPVAAGTALVVTQELPTQTATVSVVMYNALGATVNSAELMVTDGTLRHSIPTAELPAGLYYVSVRHGNAVTATPVVVR